jgi:hypothetical protein
MKSTQKIPKINLRDLTNKKNAPTKIVSGRRFSERRFSERRFSERRFSGFESARNQTAEIVTKKLNKPAKIIDRNGRVVGRILAVSKKCDLFVGGDKEMQESLQAAFREAEKNRNDADQNYQSNQDIENLVSLKKAQANVCEAEINLKRFIANNDQTPEGLAVKNQFQEEIKTLQKQQKDFLAEGFNAILNDATQFLNQQNISSQEPLDGGVRKAKSGLDSFKERPRYNPKGIGISKSNRGKTLQELDNLLLQYKTLKTELTNALASAKSGLEAEARTLQEELRRAKERLETVNQKLHNEPENQSLKDKVELKKAEAFLRRAKIDLKKFKDQHSHIVLAEDIQTEIDNLNIKDAETEERDFMIEGFGLVRDAAEKVSGKTETWQKRAELQYFFNSLKDEKSIARKVGTSRSKADLEKVEKALDKDLESFNASNEAITKSLQESNGSVTERREAAIKSTITRAQNTRGFPLRVSDYSDSQLVRKFNELTKNLNLDNISFNKSRDWSISYSIKNSLDETQIALLSSVVEVILIKNQQQRKAILTQFGFTEVGSNYQYKIPEYSTITHCNVALQFILFEAMSASEANSRNPDMPQYLVPAFPRNEEDWQSRTYNFTKQTSVGAANIFASIDPLLFQANREFLKIIDAQKPTILPPRFKTIKLLEETALDVLKAVDSQESRVESHAENLALKFSGAFTTYQECQDATKIGPVVACLIESLTSVCHPERSEGSQQAHQDVLSPLIEKLKTELSAVQVFDIDLKDVKNAALALKIVRTPGEINKQDLNRLVECVKTKLEKGVSLDILGEVLSDAFSSVNDREKISQEMVDWLQQNAMEGDDMKAAFELVKSKAKAVQEAAFALPASNKNLQEDQRKAAQKCKETSAEILEKVKALKKLQEALEVRNNLLAGGQFRKYEDVDFRNATEGLAAAYDAVYPDEDLGKFITDTLKLAQKPGKTPLTDLQKALEIEKKLEEKGLANSEYLETLKKRRFKEERDAKLQEFAGVRLPDHNAQAENFKSVYVALVGVNYVELTTEFVDLYQINVGNSLTDIEDLGGLDFDKIEDLMKVRRYLDKHLAAEEKLDKEKHAGFIQKIGEFKEKIDQKIDSIRNQKVNEFVKYFKEQEKQFSQPAAECSQEEIKTRQAIFLELIKELSKLGICETTIGCLDKGFQKTQWEELSKRVDGIKNSAGFYTMEGLVQDFQKLEAKLPDGVKSNDFVDVLNAFLVKIKECQNLPKKDLNPQLDGISRRVSAATVAVKVLEEKYLVKPIMDHIAKRFAELDKILANGHPVTIIISDQLHIINNAKSLEGDNKTKFKFDDQQSQEVSKLISSKIKELQGKHSSKVSVAGLESANEGEPSVAPPSATRIHVVAADASNSNLTPDVDGVEGGVQQKVVMLKIVTTPGVSMVIRDDKAIEDMIYRKYVEPSLPSPKAFVESPRPSPSPSSRQESIKSDVGVSKKETTALRRNGSFQASGSASSLLEEQGKLKRTISLTN